MRYAVFGDIHGNLEAFRGVLADADEFGCDRMLCVGDVVGYGAGPSECIRLVRERGILTVAGNHDWAVVGKVSHDYFNSDARDSIEWTRQQLTEDDLAWLGGLPVTQVVDGIMLVHSSPFSPQFFDYIQTRYDVQVAFDHLTAPIGFMGHSHVPVFFRNATPPDYFVDAMLDVPGDMRVMVNVGSVGQPRDLDPRACYAVYDTHERKVYLRRVEYDLRTASESMVAAGLPSTNAIRIVLGR